MHNPEFYIGIDGILRLGQTDTVKVDDYIDLGRLHIDQPVDGLWCYYKSVELLNKHQPDNPDDIIKASIEPQTNKINGRPKCN